MIVGPISPKNSNILTSLRSGAQVGWLVALQLGLLMAPTTVADLAKRQVVGDPSAFTPDVKEKVRTPQPTFAREPTHHAQAG
jgi:hypothetical protein